MLNRKGFTLVELMVVTVIIGILTAIAVPRLMGAKKAAIASSVRSDVRNFIAAQEAYRSVSGAYALDTDPTTGVLVTGGFWKASPGNILAVTNPSNTGYELQANNPEYAGFTCSTKIGTAAVSPATDGDVTCVVP